MSSKPWYMQAAEIENRQEREQFIMGVYGFRPKEKRPVVASLLLGSSIAYLAGAARYASKAKKKK